MFLQFYLAQKNTNDVIEKHNETFETVLCQIYFQNIFSLLILISAEYQIKGCTPFKEKNVKMKRDSDAR